MTQKTCEKIGGLEPNRRLKMDGLDFLARVPDGTAAAAFFDPQYRGVLDKLSYGNEGTGRSAKRAALSQMDDDLIKSFIRELDRAIRPGGHLFLWVDKFHLCEGVAPWFANVSLERVDLITWDKQKMGMGSRSRYQCEYLLVFQKPPLRSKGIWKNKAIRDIWSEKLPLKKDRLSDHPHHKPVNLQTILISCVTEEGDLIIDPAAGSFSVMTSSALACRDFLGCDLQG